MLLTNVYRESGVPITQFGGTTMSPEFTNFQRQENWYCINLGEAGILAITSLPWGGRSPVMWRMALKNGGIAASGINVLGSGGTTGAMHYGMPLLATIVGQGGVSSALANLGIQILATITGSGGVSSAVGNLLAQISASISGSGTISSADAQAFLNALATLSGAGAISAAELEGIGELIAVLSANGEINSTLTGRGELSASIKAYGDLTPEGLRDAVWNAIASNYNQSGTMGKQLNDVGAGANPWAALIEGAYTAEDIFKILLAVAAGKTSITDLGNDNATVIFRDINDSADRITASMEGSERKDVVIDTD
jgi:hypothetical protein